MVMHCASVEACQRVGVIISKKWNCTLLFNSIRKKFNVVMRNVKKQDITIVVSLFIATKGTANEIV